MSSLLILVFAVFPCTILSSLSSEYVFSVDSVNGHNNASCLKSNGQPCLTLEYLQSHLKSVSDESVMIYIHPPRVNLSKALNFTSFKDLSLKGVNNMNPTEILCNTSYSGLSFSNVSSLSLSYICLTNCGAKHNTTTYDSVARKTLFEVSALYMFKCRNVNIADCDLHASKGTGISMLDTNGKVRIENTEIRESSFDAKGSDLEYGGGGLYITFTPCTHAHFVNHIICAQQPDHYGNATYVIYNCRFIRNVANASQRLLSNVSYSWYNMGLIGRGGGAGISVGLRAANISITFYDSIFRDNYAVGYGGGLNVLLFDSVRDIQVSLLRTKFSNNRVPNHKMGGGMQVSFSFTHRLKSLNDIENNTITLTSCAFTNNSAGSGGGVNIFSGDVPLRDDLSTISFTNCNWTDNTALHGAAVHIMPGVWASRNQGHYPFAVFTNCNISSNKVMPEVTSHGLVQTQTNGVGAFFSIQLTIRFCGDITFEHNTGTALYLSGSVASFNASSHVIFTSNNGTNGGAVSLFGRSFLFLDGPSNFSFVNNRAKQLGGGIYFQSTDNSIHQPCFIYRDMYTEKSSFVFDGNHASAGRGHHIFVSSFSSCNMFCQTGTHMTIYDCIGVFNFSKPYNDSTATPPTRFSLNRKGPITLFPGLSYHLPLVVNDSQGNKISNIPYEASVSKTSDGTAEVDPAFKYVSNNTISVTGKSNENTTLRLDTLSTDISLLMEITLAECPPGYILDGNYTCKCRSAIYYGILTCNIEAYILYGIWMGKCNESSSLCTSDCPIGYCTYNASYSEPELYLPMPLNTSKLERYICHPNRVGTLCGQCRAGHSVYFNSWLFECGRNDYCHLGALFFVLSTIIPLTIIFLAITLLDTNFASGWHGFMLFSQMVNILRVYIYANGTIRFASIPYHILNWLMFTYGFFNLEVFNIDQLSFCMWEGASALDILMVKLGSILYALALVIFTVFILKQHKLAKYFPCLSRRRYSVINGISAFFILCCAQCAKTCFQVLDSSCLFDQNYHCSRRVFFYSGDINLLEGAHIKYAVVAIIFLIFIVVFPPILLLFYPLFFQILKLCHLSESRAAIYLWKLMSIQLLDSFQSSFKDNYRSFAGLYFVYRTFALVVYSFTKNLIQYYTAVEIEIVFMIFIHAMFQPYKRRVHNIIDLLLFFNLALINGISFYIYVLYIQSKDGVESDTPFWIAVQLVLLFIPLFSVGITLIINITVLLKKKCVCMVKRAGYEAVQPVS